jgi:hypothetical protein
MPVIVARRLMIRPAAAKVAHTKYKDKLCQNHLSYFDFRLIDQLSESVYYIIELLHNKEKGDKVKETKAKRKRKSQGC